MYFFYFSYQALIAMFCTRKLNFSIIRRQVTEYNLLVLFAIALVVPKIALVKRIKKDCFAMPLDCIEKKMPLDCIEKKPCLFPTKYIIFTPASQVMTKLS